VPLILAIGTSMHWPVIRWSYGLLTVAVILIEAGGLAKRAELATSPG
jgi:hypothetical protein